MSICFTRSQYRHSKTSFGSQDNSGELYNKTIGVLLPQHVLRLKSREGTGRANMAPKGCLRSTVERESAGFLQGRLGD